MNRKLLGGMVGGGIGAFIGPVHRMAATMEGKAQFIAGAFSSDPSKSIESGKSLFLDPSRVYKTYSEMAEKEARLASSERIDFVTIVTPNSTHLQITKTFLEAGIHVICDKPLTATLDQAKELVSVVERSGKVFVLTHNYTGYPMVKQAREMVRSGALGKIIKVIVEYQQGWLARHLNDQSEVPKIWRLNPSIAGESSTLADIGTHAENLLNYITGLTISELCADMTSFIPGSVLDDDAGVLIHLDNGAKGIISVSQISTGEENGLSIRIYGTDCGLEWHQQNPNYLVIKNSDGVRNILSKGNPGLCKEAYRAGKLPPGHPDGFIEAFANVYNEAFRAINAKDEGRTLIDPDYPTVYDGLRGMKFIRAAVESSKKGGVWVRCEN